MHTAFLPSKARQTGIALATSFIAVAAPAIRVRQVPNEEWPKWAKDLAMDRQPLDNGIGDTVAHIIGDTKSAAFKNWFVKIFGRTCGCTERQRWLNQKYPYSSLSDS
jgi:hypothetical protein